MKWLCVVLSVWPFMLHAEEKNEASPQAQPQENSSSDTMPVRPLVNDTASPQLDPFVISVVKEDTVVAYFRMILQVMIKDPNLVDSFYHHVPRLRDLIFTDMYSALCDQWLPTDDPQPESLKKRIQKITDQYFGPGKVEVYINHTYLQRFDQKQPDQPQKPQN